MSQEKAQLIAPQGHFTVPGLNVAGVVTASSFSGNCTGTASSIAKGTNVVVGVMTASSFVGDVTGNVTGIGSNTDNLHVGVVTATSFAGNFTGIGSGLTGTPNVVAGVVTATKFVGNTPGTVSKLADGTNINVGVVTATKFVGNTPGLAGGISAAQNINVGVLTATGGLYGDGSGLTGAGTTGFIKQDVTAVSGTTTINLNLGNVIYLTHSNNTTIAFSNVPTATDVTIIRTLTDNTITWPAAVTWDGGSAPTLVGSNTRSTAGQVFNLITADGGTTWYGYEDVSNNPQFTSMFVTGINQSYGLLGDNTTVNRSSPTQIPGNNWLRGPKGDNLKHAFKTDGTLWGWGYNGFGGLGVNDTTLYSSPIQIPGTDWSTDELHYYASDYQTGLVKTDGTLWMMGDNDDGQLGLNNRTAYSSPIQIPGVSGVREFQAVGAYYRRFSGRIDDNNNMYLWGNNYLYQFGIPGNNRTLYSSPVQIPGSWSTMGLGTDYTTAINTSGQLWSWGSNTNGKLGHNDTATRSEKTQVGSDTNWESLHASSDTCYAVKTDGTLWGWGQNQFGQLATNNRTQYSSPIQIPGTWGSSKIQVSNSSIAVQKSDATLWAWGANSYGNLGLNTGTHYSSPVQVPGTWIAESLAEGGNQTGTEGWGALKQSDT